MCSVEKREMGSKKGVRVNRRERGSALLMALMYVTLFGALAVSMTAFSRAGVEVAVGNDRAVRAYAAAESGLSFLVLQLKQMPKPILASGTISDGQARELFSGPGGIGPGLAAQLNGTSNLGGRSVISTTEWVRVPPVRLFTALDDTAFAVRIDQDGSDPHVLHLTSTGRCLGVMRSVKMQVVMEKRLRYAVYSNVAIQIGKNAVVEGDIVSTLTGFQKGPPVWMLSDFRALANQGSLDTDLVNFRNYIRDRNPAFDNRLDVRSTAAADAAAARGFVDRSGDGFIDDWDLALRRLDANMDRGISGGEYTNPYTGLPYDAELWNLIDGLTPPFEAGDGTRSGYRDGELDARDAYAKVKGTVQVRVTQAQWDAWARDSGSGGGSRYGDGFRNQFQGPVTSSDPTVPPVQFGADQADVPVILPSAFDTSEYAGRAGPEAGSPLGSVGAGRIENSTLSASMANGGTATEATPFGSATVQATYRRPVFRNVAFKNIKIPRGLNALFQNCTFEGVTYVDMETAITNAAGNVSTDPNDGMTWSKKMTSGSFSSTTPLTAGNSQGFQKGNNLRFDSCTFKGPVAAANPSAYTHFTNSWEFTGATYFDNQVDPTATILAPNTNIEMGSFANPNAAPSTLVGVVVAGNIDIRGRSVVDGSIIVTGNGAANTTLAYFGGDDGSSNPTAMPQGGYGRLYMRYNPKRSMPNGIRIPITLTPRTWSYATARVTGW